MTASDPIIEFECVKKRFGSQVVYEDLTLSVRRGETLTLLGGSGSGKSVMLKMIVGLLRPDAGTVRVGGQDVGLLREEELLCVRRRVSMLFQSAALFDSLSVGENVAWPLRERGGLGEQEIARRVSEKLALVGLPGTEAMKPAELSGGMRKRVGLARAIAADPEVLLYDEPTTGLDPLNTRRISDLICDVQERLRVTSIVVTHDLPSAFMISDRIAMLHERRILAVLPAREFLRTEHPAVRDFISAMTPPGVPARQEAP